jgi:hypothetical protein
MPHIYPAAIVRQSGKERKMYVMEYTRSNNLVFSHLYEMTAKEARAAESSLTESRWYRRIDAHRAHQHVKQGGTHSTPLWTDMDGRIRRA